MAGNTITHTHVDYIRINNIDYKLQTGNLKINTEDTTQDGRGFTQTAARAVTVKRANSINIEGMLTLGTPGVRQTALNVSVFGTIFPAANLNLLGLFKSGDISISTEVSEDSGGGDLEQCENPMATNVVVTGSFRVVDNALFKTVSRAAPDGKIGTLAVTLGNLGVVSLPVNLTSNSFNLSTTASATEDATFSLAGPLNAGNWGGDSRVLAAAVGNPIVSLEVKVGTDIWICNNGAIITSCNVKWAGGEITSTTFDFKSRGEFLATAG